MIKDILKFRPKLVPTLFVIPALILLFSLSFWQFQRLNWKQEIIRKIEIQSQLEAIELPQDLDLVKMLYRNVIVKGEFLHQDEVHIYGGSRKFKGEVGYYILTPLLLSNGKIIMVNRGWIPDNLKDSATRPQTLIKGQVEIIGAIMENEEKVLYIHDNQPEYNLWFYINLNEMGSFLKIPEKDFIASFYILAQENKDSNILPYGRDLELNVRNHHLGYALTWFFSAISLIVIYILYHRKKL